MSQRRDERGSGSLLLSATVVTLGVVMWVGSIGGSYAVTLHRARAIADRAALAGAAAYAEGDRACPAVRRQVGEENRPVTVSECQATGDAYRYVVSVEVESPVPVKVVGLPRTVRAAAHAGPTVVGGGHEPASPGE